MQHLRFTIFVTNCKKLKIDERDNDQMALRIFLADLTHDTVGLATEVFPLNIGFVGAYCKERFGDAVDVTFCYSLAG